MKQNIFVYGGSFVIKKWLVLFPHKSGMVFSGTAMPQKIHRHPSTFN